MYQRYFFPGKLLKNYFFWPVFDEHGNFKFKFGSKGRGDGQMSFPEGIAFLDWANGLLVADEGNNRVDFYNKDGKFRNHILVECDGILSPQGIWFRSYSQEVQPVPYRRFYPIITIHISLFTTNLSEYDISFFTISHHSCNKSDYSWVVY